MQKWQVNGQNFLKSVYLKQLPNVHIYAVAAAVTASGLGAVCWSCEAASPESHFADDETGVRRDGVLCVPAGSQKTRQPALGPGSLVVVVLP